MDPKEPPVIEALGIDSPGSLQERQLLSTHFLLLSSAGAGNRPGTAPGAANQPSLRQAKQQTPRESQVPTGVSVAPPSLGGKPGQFCHLQSRRRPGRSGNFALGSSEMSAVPAAKRPTPPTGLLQTRSSGRAGPQGVPLGTGRAVSPEMLVLGDSLPPWLLSERLQSDKRGSMAPQIRPSERLGHSWTHSGPP